MRSTQLTTSYIESIQREAFGEPKLEPLEEQTFTRREKKLYTATIGQRTEAQQRVTKRKTSAVGKEKQARRKARRS